MCLDSSRENDFCIYLIPDWCTLIVRIQAGIQRAGVILNGLKRNPHMEGSSIAAA